jgi:hypothetical protein
MTPGATDDVIDLRVDEMDRATFSYPGPVSVPGTRPRPRSGGIYQPIRIIVHFPKSDIQSKAAQDLAEAFRRYFSHRAAVLQGDLTELFRIGRRSLGIGVVVLIACFAIAHFANGFITESPFAA